MNNANLILHCGGEKVDRQSVVDVPTPEPTSTWFPIPHIRLVERVEEALGALHMRVTDQTHALTKEGMRYFGLLHVSNSNPSGNDFGYVLGLRNSHDRAFTASLAVGSHVFVCDNLAFSGEITIARKHTRYIEDDLPKLTGNAIGLLSQRWTTMTERYARYKESAIDDGCAHDLIIRSLDIGAATVTQLPAILRNWRNPAHEEFAERNVWRLFNAFTEVAKGTSMALLPQRTIRLHGLMDGAAGFAAPPITQGTIEEDAAQVTMNF